MGTQKCNDKFCYDLFELSHFLGLNWPCYFCLIFQPTSRRRSTSRTGDARLGGRHRPAAAAATVVPTSRPVPSTRLPGSSSTPTSTSRRRRPPSGRDPRQPVRVRAAASTPQTRRTAHLTSTLYCSSSLDSFWPWLPSEFSRTIGLCTAHNNNNNKRGVRTCALPSILALRVKGQGQGQNVQFSLTYGTN